MRGKITVIGDGEPIVRSLSEGDWADVVGPDELPGSDVVVLARGADVSTEARRVASRASGAVMIVVDGDVRAAVDASYLPRGRVVGVEAGAVREVAEAILFDRCSPLTVTMVGLDGEVADREAIMGLGGVREIRS
jgi:hypothetical protein